ncbi:MAG TPA: STAS domain-containing protein, partial [Steroidobacteraceae bacterium]|nr:STAS domain-containing protein [Steroidobacteraceae bacterium]
MSATVPRTATVEVRRTAEGLELELAGEWSVREVGAVQAALAAVDVAAVPRVRIATQSLTQLDLSGAWALREFVRRARGAGAEVSFRGSPPDQLRVIDAALSDQVAPDPDVSLAAAAPAEPRQRALIAIGRYVVLTSHDLLQGLAFLGRTCVTLAASLTRPWRLRPISIVRHVYDTGITAMPIVALIAFLISVIIAYMSAQQLRGLGAE